MRTLQNIELRASLRIIDKDGNPWFVARDVCNALTLDNQTNAMRRLEPDEKGVNPINTLGGVQKMAIVSESGLYALILRSDKPAAKIFRKWVTAEVLPAIRKTGGYSAEAERLKVLRSRNETARAEYLRAKTDLASARLQTARKIAHDLGVWPELEKIIREGPVAKPALALPAPRKPRIRRIYRLGNWPAQMPGPMASAELRRWIMEKWEIQSNAASQRMGRAVKNGILERENSTYTPKL